MVVVKRLNDKLWFWADEEKMAFCCANMTELSILFQKKFNATMEEMLNFCKARDMWQSFRVAANDDMLVMQEA